MKFEEKIPIPIIVFTPFLILYLLFYPNMSNIIIASGTMLMAIGTFLMAYYTYISYKNLANFQKATLEPALSVSLWKIHLHGQEGLDGYGVTIKNDGHGIAKKVTLWFNWATNEEKGKEREWTEYKFNKYDMYGESGIEVGNIASKDKIDISSKFFPRPGSFKEEDLYGVILRVTCEDALSNKDEKYFDSKKIYLSDADLRKFEL